MTTGLQGTSGNVNTIQLIAGALAANTVGVAAVTISEAPAVTEYYDLAAYRAKVGWAPDTATIVIRSTAGTDVLAVQPCRVMVADSASLVGGPLGVGADATKGMLNNGAALGETSANAIYHREVISGLAAADGIQVQLGVISGTDTAIRVELLMPIFNRAA